MIDKIIGWYLFIGFINAIVDLKYMIVDEKKYTFLEYYNGYMYSQLFWGYGLYQIIKRK